MDMCMSFLKYMPSDIKRVICKLNHNELSNLNEVSLTNGQPLLIRLNGKKTFIGDNGITYSTNSAFYINNEHINRIYELITKSSVYAYRRFIKEGFITIDGGHRIGIVGNYIYDLNNNSNLSDVNSFCFRINRDIHNNANMIIDDIYSDGIVKNTLIISPPGSGKTTMLRSIARGLTNNCNKKIIRCTIIDERFEIAACVNGKANYDIGNTCSVMSGCNKSIAIPMIVRSMTPDVILTDEIATNDDMIAIKYAKASGCSVIATMHGIDENNCILPYNDLINVFDFFIILSSKNGPGTIERIICDV